MSRKIEFVGFELQDGTYKEYLPWSEQVCTKEQRRALFISMFNFYMPEELRFSKNEFSTKRTLLDIFTCKINSLIPISFTHKHKMVKSFSVDVVSTNIINSFLSFSRNSKARFLTKNCTVISKLSNKRPKILLAKWIELIYNNNKLGILFDLNDIFTNLVYERIKKVNRDKKVSYSKRGISIIGLNGDETSTFVIPCFSSFDTTNMSIVSQASLAKEELQDGIHNQVYFVYPKSSSFKKHIELRLPELSLKEDEYKVKIIPYSFTFCIKNIKGKEKCK